MNPHNVKNAIRAVLPNNFRKFKINPGHTVDVESNSCYFLDVPEIPADSFRSATSFPTLLGQCLCLIPIPRDRFRVYSVRTTLSAIAFACQIIMTLLSFHWLKRTGVDVHKGGLEPLISTVRLYAVNAAQVQYYCRTVWLWLFWPGTGTVLFFGGAAITTALLINLSYNWCDLLIKWEQVEGYFGHQKNLKLKFTFISVVCIIFSMGKI